MSEELNVEPEGLPTEEVQNPDDWAPGLHMGVKALNIKTVTRATVPGAVILVCAQHNLRKGNEGHRHRHPIFGSHRNTVLLGSNDPWVIAELAESIAVEFGISPARADNIMAVECVFQPPEGWECPAFWNECLEWAKGLYQHILSAVVHRDQKRPHMHVLMLAVHDGRLAGKELITGKNGAPMQRNSFLSHMRKSLGLRHDRATQPRTFGQIMTGDVHAQRSCPTSVAAVDNMGMNVEPETDRRSYPDVQYCVELSTENLPQKEADQNITGGTAMSTEPASEIDRLRAENEYLRAESELLRADLRDLGQAWEDVMRCHQPLPAQPQVTAPTRQTAIGAPTPFTPTGKRRGRPLGSKVGPKAIGKPHPRDKAIAAWLTATGASTVTAATAHAGIEARKPLGCVETYLSELANWGVLTPHADDPSVYAVDSEALQDFRTFIEIDNGPGNASWRRPDDWRVLARNSRLSA